MVGGDGSGIVTDSSAAVLRAGEAELLHRIGGLFWRGGPTWCLNYNRIRFQRGGGNPR
jgi:hypothetical protein